MSVITSLLTGIAASLIAPVILYWMVPPLRAGLNPVLVRVGKPFMTLADALHGLWDAGIKGIEVGAPIPFAVSEEALAHEEENPDKTDLEKPAPRTQRRLFQTLGCLLYTSPSPRD